MTPSFTPSHLAEKILTSRSVLEGERKQVTVLFADMKGSMELRADRDPEEARTLLDLVVEHMMDAVHPTRARLRWHGMRTAEARVLRQIGGGPVCWLRRARSTPMGRGRMTARLRRRNPT